MEKKEFSDVSSSIRSAYQKAQEVATKKNNEYAIELFKNILKIEPGFSDARKRLRELEKEKAEQMGDFQKMIANVKSTKAIMKGRMNVNKKPLEAMKFAEDALAIFLNNHSALNLLADAAENAEARFIAIETLEIVRDLHPKHEGNIRKLAKLYEKDGQGAMVLMMFQKLRQLRPLDLEIESELKAATALASIQEGKWEQDGDYHTRLKDREQTTETEKEDRIVRAEDDIRETIVKFEEMLEAGDESIDNHRKLAGLYHLDHRYDDAIKTFNWVVEKIGTLDPSIDKAIEAAEVGKLNIKLKKLKQAGAPKNAVDALEKSIFDYRLERAENRVQTYPNDNQMRFDLALVYWEGELIDKAIEQFQIARKNPQRKNISLVYLGRCFHSKGQNDMAVEQLATAIKNMVAMDKEKLDAIYHLGITYEDMGQIEDAVKLFKDIYQINVNFRDVAKRIEKHYNKQ